MSWRLSLGLDPVPKDVITLDARWEVFLSGPKTKKVYKNHHSRNKWLLLFNNQDSLSSVSRLRIRSCLLDIVINPARTQRSLYMSCRVTSSFIL